MILNIAGMLVIVLLILFIIMWLGYCLYRMLKARNNTDRVASVVGTLMGVVVIMILAQIIVLIYG